jgi:tellurite resistance protein TehA-like permease
VGLAAAAVLAALPFFVGGALLYAPALAPLIVQAGIIPGTGPAWFVPVVPLGVLGLATAAFVISRKQRSFLVAGLLAVSGIIFMIPALIATDYLAVIVLPGQILGVISGLGILGLGVAKGIRTARIPVAEAISR